MYISKESEGLNFAVFEPSMRAKAISRLRLETDLRRAVDQREFVVHYQPTVWLATGGVVGFETSLKWSHTERDLLTPDHFMPLAQEIGLGYDLDRILLKAACEKAALWRENFPEHFPPLISVSLATDAFFRKSLTEDISDLLSESKISGHALMIGVPERTISERPEESLIMLERLRSLDIRLAVDGFKKGLSSLEFLHRLPVEALKIDSPVTSPVENGRTKNQDHLEVTQTVLTVAHEFGMEVLVRGVETREQMRELCDMECDHAQGAYFSRPVDAQNAEAILTAEPSW
jgi:EAL domain-containing protein (putative c-di-GMP-specific phosphodiesterase class I)